MAAALIAFDGTRLTEFHTKEKTAMNLQPGKFWTEPLASAFEEKCRDPLDQRLGAAVCALARGLASAQRQIEAFERQPATLGDLLNSRLDAMRLLSKIDTSTVEAARAAHGLLVAALGAHGTIHDVSEPGPAGSQPLRLEDADIGLQHLEDRLAEIRRAFAPPQPVARAGRVAA
jgi:hypothetical protein